MRQKIIFYLNRTTLPISQDEAYNLLKEELLRIVNEEQITEEELQENRKTGLYLESPAYIYELYKE
jgi:hypothetical protein